MSAEETGVARRSGRRDPAGLLDEVQAARWRPLRSGLVLFAAIVTVPTVGLVAATHIVHTDLEQRARSANSDVSHEVAVTVSQAIGARRRLIADAADDPILARSAATGDRTGLAQGLAVLASDGDFCNVTVTVPPALVVAAGAAPSCRADELLATPGTDAVGVVPPDPRGRVVVAGYETAVDIGGGRAATLRATYALTGIAGALAPQSGEIVSVISNTGLIAQSSSPSEDGLHAEAPTFLDLIRSGRPGSAQVYAPMLHTSVLYSYEPIPGSTYGTVSSVPTSIAYADANSLQRELLLGYAVFALLAAGVASGIAMMLQRQDRARSAAGRRARALAETSPDAIAVVDAKRVFRYANRSMASLLGHLDPDEIVGRPVAEWSGPDNYEPRREDPASGVGRLVSLQRSDGSAVPVESNSASFDVDGGTGKLVIIRDVTDRRRAEAAVTAAEARQREILETIPDGVVLYDLDDQQRPFPVMANPAAVEILGLELPELRVWQDVEGVEVIDEQGAPMDRSQMPVVRAALSGDRIDGTVWGVRRGDTVNWIRSSTRPVFDDEGHVSGVVACLVDITEERAVHAEVAAAHARYAALIENGTDLISVIDPDGRLRYLSPAFSRLFGWDRSWLGRHAELDVHPDDLDHTRATIASLATRPDSIAQLRWRVRTVTGDYRHLDVTCTNRLSDPWVNGIVTNSRDVTDEVEASELLRHQATHDPLTGLANRTLLLDRLERALLVGHCAVLFLDLDHFKRVNDTLGHRAGDELLEVVARRLHSSLRPGDSVARVGGDEFVVLAEGITTVEAATGLADRIRTAVTRPVRLTARTVTVGCSVGIALAKPTSAQGPEQMLQDADTALYQAKERGRNRSDVYDTAMRVRTQQRLDAEVLVREALETDRLAVVFQPVVDLRTGLPVATEALARLRGDDGNLIGPDRFIDAAEDSGLIVPLGSAVLEMACAQQARWDGAASPFTQVSVNLSARQLGEPGLAATVAEVLERHGLSPSQLCLELTESTLIDGGDTTQRAIADLKAMGITLALDDFGTGWSSLAYLRRFPIDIIKIDRSFVAGLGTDAGDTEVVRAVVGLGRALGLTTVAEGVETPGQAQELILLGCRYAQGYFYGRPAPAETLDLGVERDHAVPIGSL